MCLHNVFFLTLFKEYLKKGVDVNCRHPYGWTALHSAAANSRPEAVRFLLKNGADPNMADTFSNIYQVGYTKNLLIYDTWI